jgi:hypothetical protein
MGEPATHGGGCHCGRVRYEVATDLGTVIECNCSHCRCLDGIDLAALKLTPINGRDF